MCALIVSCTNHFLCYIITCRASALSHTKSLSRFPSFSLSLSYLQSNMSEIQFNYKSLPLVVLNNILLSETKSDLRNYALVCKAWVKPVQSILYGDVNIKTISQLEAFENSVTKNLHLGKLVKVFSLSISWSEKTLTKATKRVSNLLYNGLPNLQEFPQSSLDTYAPVLRALKNSRLKMLKVLYPPCKDEEDGYANCILLMDNRVEQVIINNKNCYTTDLTCNRLYSKLISSAI